MRLEYELTLLMILREIVDNPEFVTRLSIIHILITHVATTTIVSPNSSTLNIFSQRPLFSFKKDSNLHGFLVKGTLPSNKQLQPDIFRCSCKRCLTCPFVASRTSVTGPKSTLNITDHFDCTTPTLFIAFNALSVTSYILGKLAAV